MSVTKNRGVAKLTLISNSYNTIWFGIYIGYNLKTYWDKTHLKLLALSLKKRRYRWCFFIFVIVKNLRTMLHFCNDFPRCLYRTDLRIYHELVRQLMSSRLARSFKIVTLMTWDNVNLFKIDCFYSTLLKSFRLSIRNKIKT